MKGKKVNESRTNMTELVLPNDANTYGNVLGGKVMHLMDLAAAIAAFRHSRKQVVTISVDSVRFLHPVKVGQVLMLEAVITRAFKTSMELKVEAHSENPLTGQQRRTCTAYLTFVAIDEFGKPTEIPPLIPETEEEKKRFEEAEARRIHRLEQAAAD